MSSLWREVSSASWVADTGIPLVLTVVALLLGFWTLRRQLRHDRLLLAAQNRAEAARTLGAAILRETRRADNEPPNSSYWMNPRWMGFYKIAGAMTDAGIVLGGMDEDSPGELEYVVDQARIVSQVWQHAARKRQEVEVPYPVTWEPDESDLNSVLSGCIHPYRMHLEDIGKALMRWDGMGRLPAEPAWYDLDVPLPDTTADWEAALDENWETNLNLVRENAEKWEELRLDVKSGRIPMQALVDLFVDLESARSADEEDGDHSPPRPTRSRQRRIRQPEPDSE